MAYLQASVKAKRKDTAVRKNTQCWQVLTEDKRSHASAGTH